MRQFLTYCLFATLALMLPVEALQAQDCLKRVFTEYCLGGDATTLAEPVERRLENDREVLIYQTAGRRVRVSVEDGQIVAVAREEPPGNWLNFNDWNAKLVRLYRSGEDLSDFPRYATARNSRLNVIRAGKGKAHKRWPQDGWWVELIWDNLDYVLLNYEIAPRKDSQLEEDAGL